MKFTSQMDLTSKEALVYEAIKQKPSTIQELAEQFGVSYWSIRRVTQALQQRNLIYEVPFHQEGRKAVYQIRESSNVGILFRFKGHGIPLETVIQLILEGSQAIASASVAAGKILAYVVVTKHRKAENPDLVIGGPSYREARRQLEELYTRFKNFTELLGDTLALDPLWYDEPNWRLLMPKLDEDANLFVTEVNDYIDEWEAHPKGEAK